MENELLRQIIAQQEQIIELLTRQDKNTYPDGDSRFITSKQIREDLQVSSGYFQQNILPQLSHIIFKLRENGDYRCRLKDYRKWKVKHFNLSLIK